MKCIFIDDEFETVMRLKDDLTAHRNINVMTIDSDPDLAVKEIVEMKPDVVFINIGIPLKSGFDIVDRVQSYHCSPTFIFVTAFNQYAIAGLKENAFDYILKPFKLDNPKNLLNQIELDVSNGNFIDLNQCGICNDLSKREKEVLILILKGESSQQIASELYITKSTVNFHRKNILLKTGTANFFELANKICCVDFIC